MCWKVHVKSQADADRFQGTRLSSDFMMIFISFDIAYCESVSSPRYTLDEKVDMQYEQKPVLSNMAAIQGSTNLQKYINR
jgi:hypothetical protein